MRAHSCRVPHPSSDYEPIPRSQRIMPVLVRVALAPEPHRTTRKTTVEPSAEPAFRAIGRHERIGADMCAPTRPQPASWRDVLCCGSERRSAVRCVPRTPRECLYVAVALRVDPACGEPRSPPGLGGDALPPSGQRARHVRGWQIDRRLLAIRAHPQQHTIIAQNAEISAGNRNMLISATREAEPVRKGSPTASDWI